MRAGIPILKFFYNDWHFLLLIIFFITHGYAEYVGLVPPGELLMLLIVLAVIAFFFYWLGKMVFKNGRKAALFVTFFMAMFLFFGAFQDLLGTFHFTSVLAQLKIFFPLSLVLILLCFIILKSTSRSFTRLGVFLNVLLALYIVVDIAVICMKLLSPAAKNATELAAHGLDTAPCDSCDKPSVYLILLDEYSGSDALRAYFNYDNTHFEQFLSGQGFKVNQSTTSNYVFTLFSMASMLNMDYLHGLGKQSAENHYGYRRATAILKDNIVTHFFKQQGYRINNYSYFQLPEAPSVFKTDYLPGELALITNKTMYSSVAREAVRVLGKSISFFRERSDAGYINNNETMMKRALDEATADTMAPAFSYIHLLMPHEPVAFDSTGRRIIPFHQKKSYTKKEADEGYLQYLVYTNNRMRDFIAGLKERTEGKAIIMLMGDHGYRGSILNGETKWGYHTLNAVYLPRQNYQAWYNGMSNVNQFRALFNTSFGQRLPMLKDSLVH